MDGGNRGPHDRCRAERQRPGLARLRPARSVPHTGKPAPGARHRDLGPLPIQGQPLRQVPGRQHLYRHPQQPLMEIYTNLVWPDDPYRTGQQLYRRPAPRLAAFTISQAAASRLVPTAAAIVYLPLHRTQVLGVTGETLAFGFHAASISREAGVPALAQVADLDLMQARRHAAILAGHMLAGDLASLRALAPDAVLRGVTAVERDWADRSAPAKGRAVMLDCGLDLPGAASPAEACAQARISVSNAATCTV